MKHTPPLALLRVVKFTSRHFLISSVTCNKKMMTQTGKPFARVVLSDVTGQIEGVIWDYNGDLEEGGFAHLKIDVKLYRNLLEFATNSDNVRPVEVPLNKHDYIKGVSKSSLCAFAEEVEDNIMSIADPIYRDIMGNAIHRLDFMQALRESPYGLTGPMAYKGGLLVHVVHSMRLAQVAIGQATELEIPFSPSLVKAGCALRNIGWHTTTRFQGDHLRTRDAYHMTGVHRASARYIDHLMLTTESDLQITIPESKRQALENMCNKAPDIHTLEGKIVSCADNMADVLDFSVASLQRKQNGSWTDELFTGHLSR